MSRRSGDLGKRAEVVETTPGKAGVTIKPTHTPNAAPPMDSVPNVGNKKPPPGSIVPYAHINDDEQRKIIFAQGTSNFGWLDHNAPKVMDKQWPTQHGYDERRKRCTPLCDLPIVAPQMIILPNQNDEAGFAGHPSQRAIWKHHLHVGDNLIMGESRNGSQDRYVELRPPAPQIGAGAGAAELHHYPIVVYPGAIASLGYNISLAEVLPGNVPIIPGRIEWISAMKSRFDGFIGQWTSDYFGADEWNNFGAGALHVGIVRRRLHSPTPRWFRDTITDPWADADANKPKDFPYHGMRDPWQGNPGDRPPAGHDYSGGKLNAFFGGWVVFDQPDVAFANGLDKVGSGLMWGASHIRQTAELRSRTTDAAQTPELLCLFTLDGSTAWRRNCIINTIQPLVIGTVNNSTWKFYASTTVKKDNSSTSTVPYYGGENIPFMLLGEQDSTEFQQVIVADDTVFARLISQNISRNPKNLDGSNSIQFSFMRNVGYLALVTANQATGINRQAPLVISSNVLIQNVSNIVYTQGSGDIMIGRDWCFAKGGVLLASVEYDETDANQNRQWWGSTFLRVVDKNGIVTKTIKIPPTQQAHPLPRRVLQPMSGMFTYATDPYTGQLYQYNMSADSESSHRLAGSWEAQDPTYRPSISQENAGAYPGYSPVLFFPMRPIVMAVSEDESWAVLVGKYTEPHWHTVGDGAGDEPYLRTRTNITITNFFTGYWQNPNTNSIDTEFPKWFLPCATNGETISDQVDSDNTTMAATTGLYVGRGSEVTYNVKWRPDTNAAYQNVHSQSGPRRILSTEMVDSNPESVFLYHNEDVLWMMGVNLTNGNVLWENKVRGRRRNMRGHPKNGGASWNGTRWGDTFTEVVNGVMVPGYPNLPHPLEPGNFCERIPCIGKLSMAKNEALVSYIDAYVDEFGFSIKNECKWARFTKQGIVNDWADAIDQSAGAGGRKLLIHPYGDFMIIKGEAYCVAGTNVSTNPDLNNFQLYRLGTLPS